MADSTANVARMLALLDRMKPTSSAPAVSSPGFLPRLDLVSTQPRVLLESNEEHFNEYFTVLSRDWMSGPIPIGILSFQATMPRNICMPLYLLTRALLVVEWLEGGAANRLDARVPWALSGASELPSRTAWGRFVRAAAVGWGQEGEEVLRNEDFDARAVELEETERQRLNVWALAVDFLATLAYDLELYSGRERPLFVLGVNPFALRWHRSFFDAAHRLRCPNLAFIVRTSPYEDHVDYGAQDAPPFLKL